MNPNNLSRAQLADFARNAATQVAAGKVTGLSPEQALSISETLMAEAEILTERDREQVALRAASIEATEKARDQDVRVSRLLQSLKYGMKSVRSPADQFDAVGFDPPVRSRRIGKSTDARRTIGKRLFEWSKFSQVSRQQHPELCEVRRRSKDRRLSAICNGRCIKSSEVQAYRGNSRSVSPIPRPCRGRPRPCLGLVERGCRVPVVREEF